MPLISLLVGLAMATHSAPQSNLVAPEPGIAVAQPIATRAPDDSEWQEVLELDRSYHWTKRATFTTGIVGGGAVAAGTAILVLDVMVSVITFTSHEGGAGDSQDHMAQTALYLMGAGAVAESVALVGSIATIVQGVQLRDAEHRTGYRVSVVPVVVPRTGGYGAMARLEF